MLTSLSDASEYMFVENKKKVDVFFVSAYTDAGIVVAFSHIYMTVLQKVLWPLREMDKVLRF